jgi:hypothetical protein
MREALIFLQAARGSYVNGKLLPQTMPLRQIVSPQ